MIIQFTPHPLVSNPRLSRKENRAPASVPASSNGQPQRAAIFRFTKAPANTPRSVYTEFRDCPDPWDGGDAA